jgi:serine/threonine-protein kinase ATR
MCLTFLDSYAVASLILTYGEKVKNPWQFTQAVFGELYKHMNFAKENLKETLLVAIGSVGK